MTVERFPWVPPIADAILDAAKETGYGVTEDMVGAQITGFNIAQTMSVDGVRQSSAAAFLRPIRDRSNLHIAVNATATKIVTLNKKVIKVKYIIVSNKSIIFHPKSIYLAILSIISNYTTFLNCFVYRMVRCGQRRSDMRLSYPVVR